VHTGVSVNGRRVKHVISVNIPSPQGPPQCRRVVAESSAWTCVEVTAAATQMTATVNSTMQSEVFFMPDAGFILARVLCVKNENGRKFMRIK